MKSGVLTWGAAALVAVLAAGPAWADEVKLTAKLAGAAETAGGDADGSGAFSAELDAESGDLCYTLGVKNIAAPTMAHIHKGAVGRDGDVVVKLNVTGADGDECAALQRDLAKAIAADPAAYYVNVHTGDFPKGAVRGQLSGPGGAAAPAAPAAAPAAAEPVAPAAPVAEVPAAAPAATAP